MTARSKYRVAIVDYGLGNLFSVQQAFAYIGITARITSSRQEILAADAVVLPGVGAFGDAMAALHRLDLVQPLRDLAASPTPLIGICLGMQMLMSESEEFGRHPGLGIIEGPVVRFQDPKGRDGRILKVPQVGWNRLWRPRGTTAPFWQDTPLCSTRDGEFMYFVHSYYAKPVDPAAVLAWSRYGDITFCSAVARGSTFGLQCHPERSGPAGLQVYREVANLIAANQPKEERRHAA